MLDVDIALVDSGRPARPRVPRASGAGSHQAQADLDGLLAQLRSWEDTANTSSQAVLYRELVAAAHERITGAGQRESTTNAGGLR